MNEYNTCLTLKGFKDLCNPHVINEIIPSISSNIPPTSSKTCIPSTKVTGDRFTPKRIIKNGPAMVVFWKDGTKTIVKRKKGESDNLYHAFTAALAKKIFGSNSHVNKIIESIVDESKKEKKMKKTDKK